MNRLAKCLHHEIVHKTFINQKLPAFDGWTKYTKKGLISCALQQKNHFKKMKVNQTVDRRRNVEYN